MVYLIAELIVWCVDSMIQNKTIWVTGGTSGIGRALSETLAANGNFVFATGRNPEKAKDLCAKHPNNIVSIVADVGNAEQMQSLQDEMLTRTDFLDMVILCAGTCEYQQTDVFDIGMYQRVFDANFFGAVNTVNIAIPLLKASQQSPQIVGISSLSTLVPFGRAEAYGGSKAAFEYFLRSLNVDLKDSNIDVSIIRPGFVDTPLTRKNTFSMPWLMDVNTASRYILSAIEKRKYIYNFPITLSVILRVMSCFTKTWDNSLAPKLNQKKG